MASSKIIWGELLVAKETGKNIPENTAIDANGNMTIDPLAAMEGGLLPFAGHKGSGLAFIVELLAGGLTSSRIGYDIKGGWGAFYILIDHSLFIDITEFKNDIDIAIKELKSIPKSSVTNEIYFPGEKSFLKIEENAKKDSIFINDKYYAELSA